MLNYIRNLRNESDRLKTKADQLVSLVVLYPDLRLHLDRWHGEYFCSKEVNQEAVEFEYRAACECCSDAPMVVRPYIVENGMKLYCDPFEVVVQCKDGVPYPDWRERLTQAGYRPEIIADLGISFTEEADGHSHS